MKPSLPRVALAAGWLAAGSRLAAAADPVGGASAPDWALGLDPAFRHVSFGLAAWQWLGLGAGLVASILVGGAAAWIANQAVKGRDRLAAQPISIGVRRMLRRAAGLLAFTWTGYAASDELALAGHPASVVAKFLGAFHICGYVLLAIAVWELLSEGVAVRAAGHSARAERLLIPLTTKLVRAVIVLVGGVVALTTLANVNIAALVTSLGIGGLVVALAGKDSIENVFGSITILFDMPFALGDWVRIDKVEGVVEEINLRSTRVRTFEDTVVTLPNANLIRAAVENFGARRVRRQILRVRLSADNSADRIAALETGLREYLGGMSGVRAERAVVAFEAVDEASMLLFIQCHFDAATQAEELALRDELMLEVLRARERAGVLLAGESRGQQDVRLGRTPLK